MEKMIKLLLLAVITAQTCTKYQVAAETTVIDVVQDIKDSICHLNFFRQAFLYLQFCEDDGFDSCGRHNSRNDCFIRVYYDTNLIGCSIRI